MFIKFKNPKLYRSILISFIVLISITVLIVSSILYFNFEKIVMSQTYSYKVGSLMQNGQEVYNMNKSVSNLTVLVRQDFNIIGALYNKDPQPADFIPTLNQLKNYKSSNEFVDSIYVYNNLTKTFYSIADYADNLVKDKNDFYDANAAEMVDNILKYRVLYPIPRKIMVKDLINNKKSAKYLYTFVYYDTFEKNPDNIVFINVSQDRIKQFFVKADENSKTNTFIINKKGQVIYNSDLYPIFADTSKDKYIEKILASDKTSGYFVASVKGMKSFITYAVPDKSLDWIYVSVTPYKDMMTSINSMRAETLIIAFLILFVCVIVSFFASKKLYIPIGEMVNELDTYEIEKENVLYNLRNDYIKTMILESKNYDPNYLKEKLKKYKILLSVDEKIKIINLKIDSFSKFIIKHNEEDIKLVHYAISNIIMEIGRSLCKLQCVTMENNEVIILMNTTEVEKDIEKFIVDIQSKTKELLKISLSATFSLKECDINNIFPLYNLIAEDSLNRLIYGEGSIINSDKIEAIKNKHYEYPGEIEKMMINSLVFGNIEESKTYYKNIVEDSFNYSYKEINMAIFHIIFAIDNALNNVKKNNVISIDFNFNNVIEVFKNAETMDEVNDAFYKLLEDICLSINDKKKFKHKEMIDKIIYIIDTEYGSNDLCIEKIADNFDMNPTYIGRMFKLYTQKSINEFINDVRIKKAKELLKDKRNSIDEISIKCGFSNISYFYKVFKNKNGTTPNEYRKI